MAKRYKPRANELTAVLHRRYFEEAPADVRDERGLRRWEEFRRRYEAAHQLEGGVGEWPLQVDIELNNTCNMRCAYCVHGRGKVREKEELGWGAYKAVIDEGKANGLVSVKLNYINEPLMRADIDEHIAYAKGSGVLNVYFATNGILLTEEMGRRLIESGLTKLMVSIDAASAYTYKLIRRSNRYEEVVRNIEAFLALRERMGAALPLVRVNFLQTALNAHEAEAFVRRWDGVADMIGFQQQVRVPGDDDPLYVVNGRADPGWGFRCSFPYKLLVVGADGAILPCCTFSGRLMALGNIREMTIGEAWRSERMERLRRLHASGRYMDNPICRRCVSPAVEGGE